MPSMGEESLNIVEMRHTTGVVSIEFSREGIMLNHGSPFRIKYLFVAK